MAEVKFDYDKDEALRANNIDKVNITYYNLLCNAMSNDPQMFSMNKIYW